MADGIAPKILDQPQGPEVLVFIVQQRQFQLKKTFFTNIVTFVKPVPYPGPIILQF